MLKKINDWLEDPKRSYAFGLAIFKALASAEVKNRYGEYLSKGETDSVESNDTRFPMLINKVTAIYNNVRSNPEKYAEALASLSSSGKPLVNKTESVKQIIALREQTEDLQAQIEELEQTEENKTSEIEYLSEQLKAKDEKIEALKAELKEAGLRVLEGSDLPKSVKPKYLRIKEIVPLMASLHGEIKNEALTDEQRKAIAEQICKLDDERRARWDDINTYLNDYDTAITEEDKVRYSDDPLVRGMQIASRLKRVKENITRNEAFLLKHKEAGKADLEAKAQKRLDAYLAELDELQKMVNETK